MGRTKHLTAPWTREEWKTAGVVFTLLERFLDWTITHARNQILWDLRYGPAALARWEDDGGVVNDD